MKKILVSIICIVALAGVAYAIEVGQVINQQQLDNVNAFDVDLQCQIEQSGINTNNYLHTNGQKYAVRTRSCLDINQTREGEYTVIRDSFYVYYSHRDYHICRLNYYLDDFNNGNAINMTLYADLCSDEALQELVGQESGRVRGIRVNILTHQTEEDLTI